MSARAVERALARMATTAARLAPERAGAGFGLYPNGDRRRRPLARLTAEALRTLEAEGAVARAGDGYAITEAGRARVRRGGARADEAYAAQHRPVIDRAVMRPDGAIDCVRGHDADGVLRRIAALRNGAGGAWLTATELAAAARLRQDWQRSERGLVRASAWDAPPNGSAPRSANAREAAMAAHCDARRRVSDMLERLAPALRRVVERVLLQEQGLEALERAEEWPTRSGKLALKLALAQLAAA